MIIIIHIVNKRNKNVQVHSNRCYNIIWKNNYHKVRKHIFTSNFCDFFLQILFTIKQLFCINFII